VRHHSLDGRVVSIRGRLGGSQDETRVEDLRTPIPTGKGEVGGGKRDASFIGHGPYHFKGSTGFRSWQVVQSCWCSDIALYCYSTRDLLMSLYCSACSAALRLTLRLLFSMAPMLKSCP